ncbi:MAG: PRD domain-containing protein [Propionibacteriaceae bacterium]|nr:PRD domain-containing protein [Propionibacteriaceae bacterium]
MAGTRPPSGLVHKVLNNNLITTVDPLGRELVLMGRGLGWHLQRNDPIDYSLVEKTYVLDVTVDTQRVYGLLADVPFPVVDAVTDAVDQAAKDLGTTLSRSLPISLIDHIQFVLERLRDGIRLPAAIMPELMVLYPDEAAVAVRMRDALGASLKIELPEEEAVFLAMHLINALHEQEAGPAAPLLGRVRHIVGVVEQKLGVSLDSASPDYARFVLHVKFLVQRLLLGTMLEGDHSSFHDAARHSYSGSFRIADEIAVYVRSEMSVDLSEEELMYLSIHIERLKRSLPH